MRENPICIRTIRLRGIVSIGIRVIGNWVNECRNEFQKDYYDWPKYKLDPKNYRCCSTGCLRQIPYAGKGMLNGRY